MFFTAACCSSKAKHIFLIRQFFSENSLPRLQWSSRLQFPLRSSWVALSSSLNFSRETRRTAAKWKMKRIPSFNHCLLKVWWNSGCTFCERFNDFHFIWAEEPGYYFRYRISLASAKISTSKHVNLFQESSQYLIFNIQWNRSKRLFINLSSVM